MSIEIDIEDVRGLENRITRLEDRQHWIAAVIGNGSAGFALALVEELTDGIPFLLKVCKPKIAVKHVYNNNGESRYFVELSLPNTSRKKEQTEIMEAVKEAMDESFVLSFATEFQLADIPLVLRDDGAAQEVSK